MEDQVQPIPQKKRFRSKKTIILVVLFLIVILIISIGAFVVVRNIFFSDNQAVNPDADEQRFVVVDGDKLSDLTSVVEEYSIFNEALEESGLAKDIREDSEYTYFIPNNETFEAYFEESGTSKGKFSKSDNAKSILSYHILPQKILAQDLADMDKVKTLQGSELTVSQDNEGNLTINGVKIIEIDIEGSNGVIHVVEKVLTPK